MGRIIGIIIIAWFVYSIFIIGILVSDKSKRKMSRWSKKEKELAFRNARILALLLAIATGLLL